LADNPRPPESKTLNLLEAEAEVRRLRIEQWRIVYAITEADRAVDVLAVRRRPPYDYTDLQDLIANLLPPHDQ
jgi:mRNA interferase RelE/StbE